MKFIGSLSASVTVLAAALIIMCPMALPAAEHAPDSRIESRAEPSDSAQECPVQRPSSPSDCATTGGDRVEKTSIVMLRTDGAYQPGYGQNDSSEVLLEGLIQEGPDR